MMDWTDRHCRYFLRQLSSQALLYTEMVTTGALLHGDTQRFLRYHDCEHPLALQLGGSESADLVKSMLDMMSEHLLNGETVKLSSFGTFMVRAKNGLVGRNGRHCHQAGTQEDDELQSVAETGFHAQEFPHGAVQYPRPSRSMSVSSRSCRCGLPTTKNSWRANT